MRKLMQTGFFALALVGLATAPSPAQNNPARTAVQDDGTYGRVKEWAAGQKIVIDINNAPDKTIDLTDKSQTVNLGQNLKVGDPVRVLERDVNGRKTIDVMIDNSPVQHGDPK